ncbi:uncharacterized protein A4U43_C04F27930 [Asparagus officinalis]|uniref:Uncharacterized protein n=1 Tax=Asparagus officinalis TaxID=4686 RepID=A0A5P1F4X2_ASPOF|nr:uncharacterized protein A4U43_C04F27930 [Asparagus officinalis]
MTEAPTPSPILLVRRRLIIHGALDDDDDVSISPVPAGVEWEGPSSPKPSYDEGPIMPAAIVSESKISSTSVKVVPMDVPTTTIMVVTIAATRACLEATQHQKEELELNLAELTKRWDSQVSEPQTKMEHLSIIRS